ncbi:predicted protein [Sclerotinia sclerotiorum 1980 UF-70]|uniref:Uncharacterized protein n=1 Tax=Sclerotinia sclerotiorum (strain ATCC 18683 / 1980 / Ss-1) TaxID=665079 RepID=A7EV37_SCLS1|nr:predicted protein [Sclerotinia sclerotiorum 1980 UF-70]EDN93329.1 predicted protein [Sclerotinia sclerotiorum 1980 UF-70]
MAPSCSHCAEPTMQLENLLLGQIHPFSTYGQHIYQVTSNHYCPSSYLIQENALLKSGRSFSMFVGRKMRSHQAMTPELGGKLQLISSFVEIAG